MDLTEFLLKHVEKRPGMYLMRNKLLFLKTFVEGYSFGIRNNPTIAKDKFLENFSEWFTPLLVF